MNTPENKINTEPIVAEEIQPILRNAVSFDRSVRWSKVLKRSAIITGGTVALFLATNVGSGEIPKPVNANGPGGPDNSTPTATMTPDAQATIIGDLRTQIADLRTQVADKTPVPPTTPVPGATPVPPGSNVFVVPIPQAQPGPDRDVIVVKPEVVKPEVVKPEVVKVPEIVRIEVPVTTTPDPDTLYIKKKDFNDIVDDIVQKALIKEREKIASDVKQKEEELKTQIEVAKKAQQEAEVAKVEAKARDWTYNWWYALVGGAVGLGLGLASATREFVVERIHPHHQ